MTIRRALRSWACVWIFGGHELYLEWSGGELYQRCVLCAHRSAGWHAPTALRYRTTWMRR